MAIVQSDLIDRSTTPSGGCAPLLAPRDAGEHVARARFVLAMLAAVTVVTLTALLAVVMP
ncbi:hypothetical protein [Rhodococcus sp. NPDC059234]|uniref:hypothetical protein n=1 Tax=Rhodococcus sp. NPDC059234 TaxID=3346781 RepID=UPI003672EAA2